MTEERYRIELVEESRLLKCQFPDRISASPLTTKGTEE